MISSRAFVGALALAGLAFCGVTVLAWAFQRRLIYLPFGDVPSPAALGLNRVETVAIPTTDGLTLAGWYLTSSRPDPGAAILVCSGNGGNRAHRAGLGAALRGLGLPVLLFDYRGYGENAGTPSEAGLTADAAAARAWLAARTEVDPTRIVLFGESLGAAVAVASAVEEPPAALILRSPFTSLVDAAKVHYPFLPVGWLLRDRYPSLERIGRLRCPLLVIAGDADRIIPVAQSRRLFEAAPEPKRFLVLPGLDHNDPPLSFGPSLIEDVWGFRADVVGRRSGTPRRPAAAATRGRTRGSRPGAAAEPLDVLEQILGATHRGALGQLPLQAAQCLLHLLGLGERRGGVSGGVESRHSRGPLSLCQMLLRHLELLLERLHLPILGRARLSGQRRGAAVHALPDDHAGNHERQHHEQLTHASSRAPRP